MGTESHGLQEKRIQGYGRLFGVIIDTMHKEANGKKVREIKADLAQTKVKICLCLLREHESNTARVEACDALVR